MVHIETELRVVRRDGRIAELHIKAKEETEQAGFVCHWMPKAILNKTASVDLTDDKLTLACPSIGSLSFAGSAQDLEDIRDIITAAGSYQDAKLRLFRCHDPSGFQVLVFTQ